MNKLFSIALMAVVFASCQNSDSSETTTTDTSSTTTFSSPATTTFDSNASGISSMPTTSVAPATSVTPAAPATTSTPAVKTAPNTGKTAGLNPAHGEPGHRCDIAVGAPLNSPAGSNPAAAMNNNPAPTMAPAPAPAPAQTGNKNAKLNPAHGEPGHDCKVAVGAPLP